MTRDTCNNQVPLLFHDLEGKREELVKCSKIKQNLLNHRFIAQNYILLQIKYNNCMSFAWSYVVRHKVWPISVIGPAVYVLLFSLIALARGS